MILRSSEATLLRRHQLITKSLLHQLKMQPSKIQQGPAQ